MLVALSDTHGSDDPRLTPHLREVVEEADTVVHAGDFGAMAVLTGFRDLVNDFHAVYGNVDGPEVRDELPETITVACGDHRVVVAHGHRHDELALSLLARQEAAGVAIVGHSHRPGIADRGTLTVVNPGSHADPRGARAAYAVLKATGDGLSIELRTVSGEVFDQFTHTG